MSKVYIHRLAEHYQRYAGERVYCVAPDEYLNPYQTMQNWQWWQETAADVPIVPVIQFERVKMLDLFIAMKQARFYAPYQPQFLAISTPATRAMESRAMIQICATVRRITGVTWLHNLGAGWSPSDIAEWRDLNCFDSIDSISYYQDAMRGWRWRLDGKRERTGGNWRELARHNARVAVEIASS